MKPHPASFRDPCGQVFVKEGVLYRSIQSSYFKEFEHLEQSGLLSLLQERKLLVSHTVVERGEKIILRPQPLPFISYPCEWSFSALKQAALLHLEISRVALEHGMILKDASGYNVQFVGSHPIFIDTPSFDLYKEGTPWQAYGQFCRHFMAPLLLMSYRSEELGKVLSLFMDGLPLDMASALLPLRSHLSPYIALNLHAHARSLLKNRKHSAPRAQASLSRKGLENLLGHAKLFLEDLTPLRRETEWGDYYQFTNYSEESFSAKENVVAQWLERIGARRIWDVGGNDGHFSRKVAPGRELVISSDIDPVAVDKSFEKGGEVLSLLVDILNPTPGIGFANQERTPFLERVQSAQLDGIMALALIHHLCISGSCSFEMIARLFSELAPHLIIEFVHREDSWVKRLLDNMGDRRWVFDFYRQDNFEKDFSRYFSIEEKERVSGAERTLYLMRVGFPSVD